jgi:Bacteriophage T4-like portal protein (Gp20)
MAEVSQNPNRIPNYSRNFVSQILQRLPYIAGAVTPDISNPKYELFDRLAKRNELKVMQQSVITGPFMRNEYGEYYNPGSFTSDHAYHRYIYANIDSDKIRRLAEYRRMASYAEISDCLDEICDELIVKDENGKIVHLNFSSFSGLTQEVKNELLKEFNKFVNIYDLENKGWGYGRRLLTEGEIFFENVIHEEKRELGIIGVLTIPGELINPIYDNVQNSVIENFVFQKPIDMTNNPAAALSQVQSNVSPINSLQQQIVTLQGNQVTYIHSGMWNEDQSIRIPFIENARRAYKQLSLLEDSIIIYRMVRAPERLKFKIDVGNMPPAKAESYMKQLMQQYWSKQTYNSDANSPGAGNQYNPQTMLDSYWFARRNGEVGSDVEMMNGGQNLGKLDDLLYFVNKLYKSLKVPETRLNPNEPFKDGTEMLRQELRFAKFICRVQQQIATGLKDAFVTHLKLRGWWKELKLHESYVNLHFTPPSNFFALRQQQLLELKLKNFSDMSQNEGISNTFAQRHYLDYSDAKIGENMEWKRKDAALKWELGQIEGSGPNWREHMEAAQNAATEAGGPVGGGGGGGGGGISASSIPEFGGVGGGGTPPPPEGEAGEAAPEGGAAPAGAEAPAPEAETTA